VPDKGDAIVAKHSEQVSQAACVGAERVVTARLGRLAVAQEVGGDHAGRHGEALHHRLPGPAAACDSVQEDDHRSVGACHPVGQVVAVQPGRTAFHADHAHRPRLQTGIVTWE
jgi:hypothetical protein